jgi:hypothetical protein
MSAMTRAAEPVTADFERREPRCRVCRDPDVRTLVNELLDWRGVPIVRGRGKIHRITLTEILRDLEALNEGRDARDRITYDSLWIHFQRHYSLAGRVAYRRARARKEFKEFKEFLRRNGA